MLTVRSTIVTQGFWGYDDVNNIAYKNRKKLMLENDKIKIQHLNGENYQVL